MPTETPQPPKEKPPVQPNSVPTDPVESGDPVVETK
jgi:hypothetical protein